ncbi:reprolysin-like metallopeptidase [uncultured Croceitalea sp.]|uniref:reprolysin-like metallopeptidase n=1 Tax=uncultured Croceitalea sp. TaxID=1798908 RepID=UPI0033057933
MRAKLHFVLSISIFFIAFSGWSQDGYWKSIAANEEDQIISASEKSSVFNFEEVVFKQRLDEGLKKETQQLIYFPEASGKIIGFKVEETPVFHPILAAKYPKIKSYTGWSPDKKHKIRFSSSPKGIQGMLVSVDDDTKATFIEKRKSSEAYIAYQGRSRKTHKDGFVCKTDDFQKSSISGGGISKALVDDQTLRTYRIAVSATGEYTQYHGGTVADALAAINATLTRVNEVFETDLSVHLQLVPNNDLVIFTDPNTDPYTGNLNAQAQSTLTATIGEANYDVGHVFQNAANNGNAGFIGSVCSDNRKGSAFSSGVDPQGDLFDIDFVAHELGHQFGANHTWSFESEDTGVQAEPASGTTIMGYAGIVEGNNVEPNGDDYFHYHSILQITTYLQSTSCGQTASLTNSPPVISPVPNYTIPKGTAFVLDADVTDADTGDVLTYTWEQIDDGVVVTSTFGPENASGANFRSKKPTTNTERYFPRLSSIVQGNLTQTNPAESSAWETVATIEREFNFAFTARDNATGGGQVSSELTQVNTVNAAGPFVVTSQTTNEVYQAGSIQTITWDVANTDKAPINAQSVTILLSLDGGATFPLVIADNIPNSGTAQVQLPGDATTAARIMVKASDNIFLAVNTSNFTIQESQVVLNFQEIAFETCQPNDIIVPFTLETYAGFNEEVTFSAMNMPSGLVANFSPTSATGNNTAVTATFSNTGSVAVGNYPILIRGTATGLMVENTINLNVYNASFSDVTLLLPSDLETNTRVNPQLEWEANPNNTQYDIEIATDLAFTTIVESATVDFEFYQTSNLLSETNYFWRVRPRNNCGVGTFGIPFSFTTSPITCTNIDGRGLPIEISNGNASTITSTISVLQDLPIADLDVNLEISHSFLEDLIITLTSPSGTTITLLSKNCGSRNDINAVFDDDGITLSCAGASPTINGTIKPLGSLSSFNGESSLGDWILQIEDTANGDGGSLDSFALAICVEGILRPDDDEDGVFDDGDDLCLGTPKGVEVDVTGCPIYRFAAANFNIKVQSESCRNNNDGSIEIEAVDDAISYTATLVGDNGSFNGDFMDSFLFENLLGGNYRLCITGTNAGITYEESCFDILVGEPDVLAVASALVENSLQAVISLGGGTLYNVEVNGVVTQTENAEITVTLQPGINELKVFTNLPCQGSFKESLFVATSPIIYPNPVEEKLNIFLNQELENVDVQLFDINGRLVYKRLENGDEQNLELGFETFPVGVYFLRITGRNFKEEFKVLKK